MSFYNCANLSKVTIPGSVKQIERAAFKNCPKLQKIEIPDSVTIEKMILSYRTAEIKANAFTNCTKLTEITIPRFVTTIADSVFSYPGKQNSSI